MPPADTMGLDRGVKFSDGKEDPHRITPSSGEKELVGLGNYDPMIGVQSYQAFDNLYY